MLANGGVPKLSVGSVTAKSGLATASTTQGLTSAAVNTEGGAMNSVDKKSVKIEVQQFQYSEIGPSKLLSTEYFDVSEGERFSDLRINLSVMQATGPILEVVEIQDAENAKVMLTQNLTSTANPSPKDLTYTITLKIACHRVGPIDGGGNICLRIVK
jgi:hypothetical protein